MQNNAVAIISDYDLGLGQWLEWPEILEKIQREYEEKWLVQPTFIGASWNRESKEKFEKIGAEFISKPYHEGSIDKLLWLLSGKTKEKATQEQQNSTDN